MKRLVWLDIAKGLAILWVVYFHLLATYLDHRPVPPDNWNGIFESAVTALRLGWLKISGFGLHSIGVFLILNGWTLTQSTMRRDAAGPVRWMEWYRVRLLRLYPMYWVAHLVYLISPFVARWEQVDRRIVLSLLGLRFIHIDVNFYYLNASWWFFCMIIQFYLIFPLLFRAAQRLGPWRFLFVGCAVGFFVRYLLLIVFAESGAWIQGGFAISRLPEFAFGMALGMWHSQNSARIESFLLRGGGFVCAFLLYPAALFLYHNAFTYIFVDFATGVCCLLAIVGVAGFILRISAATKVFALIGSYSFGIFLIHQPYVIWLGLRIREQPMWLFPVIALGALAVLSAWGIVLEKGTNSLVQLLVPAKRRRAT